MLSGVTFMVPVAFIVGLSPLVGQALGSGNKEMAGTWLQLAVFWCVVGSIPSVVVLLRMDASLSLLGFPPEICTLAGSFGFYNIFWVPARITLSCCTTYFRALGMPKPAMYNDTIFLVVHVFVNWVLIFGGPFPHLLGWHGLGFIGGAGSISVTRDLEAISYLMYMFVWKRAHLGFWPGWNIRFLRREPLTKFLAQCLPQMASWVLQGLIDQSSAFMMTSLGIAAIAANSAVYSLSSALTAPLFRAVVPIMGARVGFHLGAGDDQLARRTALLIFSSTACSIMVISAILLPLGYQAMSLVTNDAKVQGLANELLPALMLSSLFNLVRCLNTDGVLASQGRTRLSALISMGLETPLSIGGVAIAIYYFHANLQEAYWCQAAIAGFLATFGMLIFSRSDWKSYVLAMKTPLEMPVLQRARSSTGSSGGDFDFHLDLPVLQGSLSVRSRNSTGSVGFAIDSSNA